MDLSEKSEFILCEIKSSLFHDTSHRNEYITAFRSVCDAYHLFGSKVKNITPIGPLLQAILVGVMKYHTAYTARTALKYS